MIVLCSCCNNEMVAVEHNELHSGGWVGLILRLTCIRFIACHKIRNGRGPFWLKPPVNNPSFLAPACWAAPLPRRLLEVRGRQAAAGLVLGLTEVCGRLRRRPSG